MKKLNEETVSSVQNVKTDAGNLKNGINNNNELSDSIGINTGSIIINNNNVSGNNVVDEFDKDYENFIADLNLIMFENIDKINDILQNTYLKLMDSLEIAYLHYYRGNIERYLDIIEKNENLIRSIEFLFSTIYHTSLREYTKIFQIPHIDFNSIWKEGLIDFGLTPEEMHYQYYHMKKCFEEPKADDHNNSKIMEESDFANEIIVSIPNDKGDILF